ncbi:hypothetical protein MRX96_000520 [Rhipicephalus microplus]
MSTTEKALKILRYLPRVNIGNLRDTPGSNYVTKSMLPAGPRLRAMWKKDGAKHHMRWARLGYEGGQTPFYLKIPMENYNEKHFLRRQLISWTPRDRHFGVHLTAEGMDDFKAKINIEVQHAREPVIAAIEAEWGHHHHCLLRHRKRHSPHES